MKLAILLIFALFGLLQTNQSCDRRAVENTKNSTTPTPRMQTKFEKVLPPDIKPETEVRKDILNDKGEVVSSEITTVEKLLIELKARVEKDKLVDEKGRQIRFFEPLCRGVSAGFEQDREDREAKDAELAELRKKYTVIILYCDPSKMM